MGPTPAHYSPHLVVTGGCRLEIWHQVDRPWMGALWWETVSLLWLMSLSVLFSDTTFFWSIRPMPSSISNFWKYYLFCLFHSKAPFQVGFCVSWWHPLFQFPIIYGLWVTFDWDLETKLVWRTLSTTWVQFNSVESFLYIIKHSCHDLTLGQWLWNRQETNC